MDFVDFFLWVLTQKGKRDGESWNFGIFRELSGVHIQGD